MKNIKEIGDFFINLNEYVYATDIETNEIVYMNHKALEAYGLESIEDIKGLKCYEVLQKASVKCGMCNNSRLLPGAFDEWRYYNPVLDKYMIIKDTLIEGEGNRKYRLEIGIDISEEFAQDKLIQKYRETEALVNEGLRAQFSASVSADSGGCRRAPPRRCTPDADDRSSCSGRRASRGTGRSIRGCGQARTAW